MKNTPHIGKIIFLICLQGLLLSMNCEGQYWIQKAGGITIDEGIDIAVDGAGNTYATGYFTATANFGAYNLTSSGVEDIYLVKLNSSGVYQWAQKAGGSGSDRPTSIKTDAAGNSYITGFFYGTATFGGYMVTASGAQDVFIAKYDNTGLCLWAKSAGGSQSDIGNGIAIDNAGNVIVTGEFKGTASFGATNLTSQNGSVDIFTTKLDGSGNFLWAKKGSGNLTDRGIDVACDGGGNIYITGQFSDTITFDITHNNNMMNAVFVVKYNSSGTEQWFVRAGGGILNSASGIAVDNGGNPIVSGDFQGTMTIFTPAGSSTLTNTYPNRIFALKLNASNGNLTWSIAHGSNGNVTSKNISTDAGGNAYIIGNFECRFNQYADQYGQGTFNSVGYWDIFVTKINSGGTWQWSRQLGGHKSENGTGIVINGNNQALITGSYNQDLIFPEVNSSVLGYNAIPVNGCVASYCSDSHYDNYESITTSGNLDGFISNGIDLNRQPYDFYKRSGGGCNRPANSVCIWDGSLDCPDTLKFCQSGTLYANTKTCGNIGPTFTYHWSNGGGSSSINVSTTGHYSVTITSADGCFTSSDTIYVKILPPPAVPTITDNHGFNTNATTTVPIVLCVPNSALLTGGNYGNNQVSWTGPTGGSNTSTFTATQSGNYTFTVTDTNGCKRSNTVHVELDSAFAHSAPKMVCPSDTNHDDTVKFCVGGNFKMYVYDTLSNPFGADTCPPYSTVHWTATPNTITYSQTTPCPINTFVPTASGWYNITATWIRINICDTDTIIASKSIYVVLWPVPILPQYTMTITGRNLLCPSGDSVILVAHGTPTFSWSTGSSNDSIVVNSPGGYSCSYSYTETNSYGCSASTNASAYINVTIKPQPTITSDSSGVICPNDSVLLTCSGAGSFLWQGPSGPIGGNNNPIYVNQPGSYYCTLTDTNNCVLVSNTIIITQYTTPYLEASNNFICPNDSVVITVNTNPSSTIQWQAPLSGNATHQTIHSAGTYVCNITSCGITTTATIVISTSNPLAHITPDGPLTFCAGDSVTLTGNSGMAAYLWNPMGIADTAITINQSGHYTLITTDSHGCTANDTITVTVTPAYTPPSLTISPDTVFCPGDSVKITVNTNPLSIIQWAAPLTGSSFTQYVHNTGIYSCSTTYCNITAIDSILIRRSIPLAHITPLGPIIFCGGDSLILDANTGMATYKWLPDTSTQLSINVFKSGLYTLNTTDTIGCKAKDTLTIHVIPNDEPIRPDTTVCYGAAITLTATGNQNIEWYASDTSTAPFNIGYSYNTPQLLQPVTYYIMSNTGVCKTHLVPIVINIEVCYLFIPNVFTPNGDGKNDFWTIDAKGFIDLKAKIYNRWGMLVYEWTGIHGGWDGHVLQTGLMAPDGTYYWIAEMTDVFDHYSRQCGYLTLIKGP